MTNVLSMYIFLNISSADVETGASRYSFICSNDNLSGMHKSYLRVYRNEVFARKGRTFKSRDLNQIFVSSQWYSPDPKYADSKLDSYDQSCVALISKLEQINTNPKTPDLNGDGQGDTIFYDGRTLKINESSMIFSNNQVFESAQGTSGLISVHDFDYNDKYRELLVVTDPGIEDEFEFQILRYDGVNIIPLLEKPVWLPHQSFEYGVGSISHVATGCGTKTVSRWTFQNDTVNKTEITTGEYNPELCAACPSIYKLSDSKQFVGEIIKNQYSEKHYGPDRVNLGKGKLGDRITLRLVELKPEVSYLDQVQMLIIDSVGKEHSVQPEECQGYSELYCSLDNRLYELSYGNDLELSFVLSTSGTIEIEATGFYIPSSVTVK